jgi:Oxidoreductase family, NAD-binding Rossmann fold
MKRRDFLEISSKSGLLAFSAPAILFNKKPQKDKAKIGFIGLGERGRSHLEQALFRNDVEIIAICDIDPLAIAESLKMISNKNFPAPAVYSKNDHDFENLVKRDDLDGVIIATPWEWHVPMALAAMKQGKYAGVEVSATVKLQESWDLVNMHEKTGAHCMLLENVCYRRDVMAVLNMVRQNKFGELIHTECGYQHDLRGVKFNDGKSAYGKGVEFGAKGFSESKWRTQHSIDRNGDIYPTHGLGPVANMLNINYGNQFLYLTSMASKSRGLHEYIVKNGGENHPNAKVKFKLGDVVTTNIKCANGETILISHDTNLPRTYSLGFRVQGTNGIWMDVNKSIYLEGISKDPHHWEAFEKYQTDYDHPLWKKYEKQAEGAGHGGMDWFVLNSFIESVKRKITPPIDTYDAAAWSAISPLSEMSIAQYSASIKVPDFTRGKWKTRKPNFALSDDF